MKLDVVEQFEVVGLGTYETLQQAMKAIDAANKPGSFTIRESTKVVASGAGIEPGKPAVGGKPLIAGGAAAK